MTFLIHEYHQQADSRVPFYFLHKLEVAFVANLYRNTRAYV